MISFTLLSFISAVVFAQLSGAGFILQIFESSRWVWWFGLAVYTITAANILYYKFGKIHDDSSILLCDILLQAFSADI